MRMLKSLVVIVAALSLPSCTVYVRDDHPARHPCSAHAGDNGGDRRFGMIGISLTRAGESRRDPLVVEHVLPNSPAGDAAIHPGDGIRAIDGESTRGMTVAEAVQLIRGPVDTAVELRVESPRGARLVTLVRVSAHSLGGGRGCHHGRHHACENRQRRSEVAPEAPRTDESLAPEVWPPTKPGHHLP
jgi:membrane-associated protease RseP (regulator of RpoE activity)